MSKTPTTDDILTLAAQMTDAQLLEASQAMNYSYWFTDEQGIARWESMPEGIAECCSNYSRTIWRLTPLGIHVLRVARLARECQERMQRGLTS